MTSRLRPALTTALAVLLLSGAAVSAPPTLGLQPYASGFSNPVAIVQDPIDPAVQFVVEQRGRIRTVVSGVVQPDDFLDLRDTVSSGGERGLLGLAFPPDAAVSRRFFVNYTDLNGHTVVARYVRSANPRLANAASRAKALIQPLMEMLAAFGIAGVVLYGGYSVIQGGRTPGDFMAFLTAPEQMLERARHLGRVTIGV